MGQINRIMEKMIRIGEDGQIADESRLERSYKSVTCGKKVPIKEWDQYANMAIVLPDGCPIYDMWYTSQAVYTEMEETKCNIDGWMKRVSAAYPSKVMTDVLHPCGLLSCNKIIRNSDARECI